MPTYTVIAYVNVAEDNFTGYKPRDPVARVDQFQVEAATAREAAERFWVIGNKMGTDDGAPPREYPRDVRSLSVGDLLSLTAPGEPPTFLSVDAVGFSDHPEPANPIVDLSGTFATSRVPGS